MGDYYCDSKHVVEIGRFYFVETGDWLSFDHSCSDLGAVAGLLLFFFVYLNIAFLHPKLRCCRTYHDTMLTQMFE